MSDDRSKTNDQVEDVAPVEESTDAARSTDGMEELLDKAEAELAAVDTTSGSDSEPKNYQLDELGGLPTDDGEPSRIDLLKDVDLNLRIELGRTHMRLEDVLELRSGSVVALDRLAGDPVDVFVNDRLVAKGEVLVLNESFCVRVTELVTGGKS